MTLDQQGPRVRYELPLPGVARIVLARADLRNAQDRRMLYDLNDAFDRASQDDGVRVIVLAADGPHFSSGHDLRDSDPNSAFVPVGCCGGFDLPGMEGFVAREREIYFDLCWRWRNLTKPTIASVQGKAIAGGLMLVWVCDLVVASEEATFSDPVVAFGVSGVEYFAHPWELGVRRAKELLFTGEPITAAEALQVGMVNRVVPLAELEARTLALAEVIATKPTFALKLAKDAANQAQEAQGFYTALRAAFGLHELCHAHNLQLFHSPVDPSGIDPRYRVALSAKPDPT